MSWTQRAARAGHDGRSEKTMKTLALTIFALMAAYPCFAALHASKSKARETPTKAFHKIFMEAALLDGKQWLTVTELEAKIGKYDEAKATDMDLRGPKLIYTLSEGRQLQVTELNGSVIWAIIVSGKKIDLIWK